MKTLADLKRDLTIGKAVTLIDCAWDNHKYLNKKRYVVKTQGNGVYLNEDKDATNGSFFEFPKASLTEYDGETLTTYRSGERELTEEERKVMDTKPSVLPENAKQMEIDMLTDGSQMFYADKRHLHEHGMEHLSGFEKVRGLKYNHNTGKVEDDTLKGEMELQYKLT